MGGWPTEQNESGSCAGSLPDGRGSMYNQRYFRLYIGISALASAPAPTPAPAPSSSHRLGLVGHGVGRKGLGREIVIDRDLVPAVDRGLANHHEEPAARA